MGKSIPAALSLPRTAANRCLASYPCTLPRCCLRFARLLTGGKQFFVIIRSQNPRCTPTRFVDQYVGRTLRTRAGGRMPWLNCVSPKIKPPFVCKWNERLIFAFVRKSLTCKSSLTLFMLCFLCMCMRFSVHSLAVFNDLSSLF